MIFLQEKGAMMQNKKKTDPIPWKLLKDGGLNKDWDSQLQGYDF